MPNFERFCTLAGEELSRTRGSLDRLCGCGSPLKWPQRHQDPFMAAMREGLACAILAHPQWAEFCWKDDLAPRDFREFSDLQALPLQMPALPLQLRHLRRWTKVAQNCLADLGLGRARRRGMSNWRPRLQAYPMLAQCRLGNWHLPRIWHWSPGHLWTPTFAGDTACHLKWDQESVACGCGHRSPAFTKSLQNIPALSP
jgi:hypothetical protein